jgi:hypothetical protein
VDLWVQELGKVDARARGESLPLIVVQGPGEAAPNHSDHCSAVGAKRL